MDRRAIPPITVNNGSKAVRQSADTNKRARAQDYISQAPDGRNKDMQVIYACAAGVFSFSAAADLARARTHTPTHDVQVTVVTYKNEPDSFRSHFPYWLAWTPMVGDQADNIAQSVRSSAQVITASIVSKHFSCPCP